MRHRVMCVPVRHVRGQVCQVLVVTNRGGRWVFPRGKRKAKESPAKCARRESYEEAGVVGKKIYALGLLSTNPSPLPHLQVDSYLLQARKTVAVYAEQAFRQRQWVTLQELPQLIQRSYCPQVIQGVMAFLNVSCPQAIGGSDTSKVADSDSDSHHVDSHYSNAKRVRHRKR